MTVIGIYFMTAQPLEYFRFFMVLNMAILVSLVAQSIGLLMGAGLSIEVSIKTLLKNCLQFTKHNKQDTMLVLLNSNDFWFPPNTTVPLPSPYEF